MSQKSVFITGANRGIGLGLAQRFLTSGARVYAAARNPDGARELWELERDFGSRVKIVQLDVTDERDLAALPSRIEAPLDILINNAGVLPESDNVFANASEAAMLRAYKVNVIGPMRVSQVLLPALRKASLPIIATVSSKVGSIADNTSGGMYSYRVSKTAMNMLNKCMSIELGGIVCVVLHPGWVQTSMGGTHAPVSVGTSVAHMFERISGLTAKDTGKFFDYQGSEIPW